MGPVGRRVAPYANQKHDEAKQAGAGELEEAEEPLGLY